MAIRHRKQVNRSYPSENHAIADTTSSFRPETLLQPHTLPAALPNSQPPTIQQLLIGKFSFPTGAAKYKQPRAECISPN